MPRRSEILMGTCVTIEVPRDDHLAIDRAFDWFRSIEACCSRFAETSELAALARCVGEPVGVSPALFEAVRFALEVARETGGAFDPTVGVMMHERGFDREYSTGARSPIHSAGDSSIERVSFRDVRLDVQARTITLERPLMLDLGAVAKGLAVDLAARELQLLKDFAIDAGGDVYLGGVNAAGQPWAVGVRHPLLYDQLIETVHVSDRAVCTSGNYERRHPDDPTALHIVDPRGERDVSRIASVTVIAASTMLADALATAAFVLGAGDGLALLERVEVEGCIITADMTKHVTAGWPA
jgi:thiamine biosynthesis lipoprotein